MAIEEVISAQAVARYIRMSPTKVRRVLNQIRGCTYEEALILLEFLPYRACEPVWQVVQSAAANVQSKHGLNKQDLIIREVFVSPGPVLKRFRPRAQGRAFAIRKPTCHITAVVGIKN
ncbi:50S ribosomal protein L22 (chloroplast) [Aureococcus anophagefferens]|jgi:large subunit ribosomal protein L22|uniref:50S ribosomal protein L22 n=2 Tax=Aureococcus anophagefferens TaxID=44056 RepID=A0ABR1G5C0_AURAN|nr:50S ribosomal protein L22 [Aureococcus anophagefferens]ACS36815.1 50S ribosomal protein L22 [Aureococcus anophagefferens]KAH8042986.1 50S ribosomal protein L22 [Aureococcus anophagefferens]KAH8043085.1 50S ribosomal protein L22 [Aureococcus anophagefferens]KAH8043288.1 50S ribosomal protein L22 [Aureococcus anophagefferens]|tara:strand:+ start:101 stop:454 length:354 start_codon:yes stop_codon:yes gene_type:complete